MRYLQVMVQHVVRHVAGNNGHYSLRTSDLMQTFGHTKHLHSLYFDDPIMVWMQEIAFLEETVLNKTSRICICRNDQPLRHSVAEVASTSKPFQKCLTPMFLPRAKAESKAREMGGSKS